MRKFLLVIIFTTLLLASTAFAASIYIDSGHKFGSNYYYTVNGAKATIKASGFGSISRCGSIKWTVAGSTSRSSGSSRTTAPSSAHTVLSRKSPGRYKITATCDARTTSASTYIYVGNYYKASTSYKGRVAAKKISCSRKWSWGRIVGCKDNIKTYRCKTWSDTRVYGDTTIRGCTKARWSSSCKSSDYGSSVGLCRSGAGFKAEADAFLNAALTDDMKEAIEQFGNSAHNTFVEYMDYILAATFLIALVFFTKGAMKDAGGTSALFTWDAPRAARTVKKKVTRRKAAPKRRKKRR